jgi:hypothetical protein
MAAIAVKFSTSTIDLQKRIFESFDRTDTFFVGL